MTQIDLQKISDYKWQVPRHGGMHVPGIIYGSEQLLKKAVDDNAISQVVNVACLPGIRSWSLAMPDVHWGYGAPIGGVGGFDATGGVIVPGFVGYDINCGVRLLRTNLRKGDIARHIETLADRLFQSVPSGVGSSGSFRLKKKELAELLSRGARWAVEKGYGDRDDLAFIEDGGCLAEADPDAVSNRAYERGLEQSGTLGSGNHFLEVQEVVGIHDREAADVFGLFEGQVTVMVHTGSRGLGYQVCDEYLAAFIGKAVRKYDIKLPDRQLACAPVSSYEGRRYWGAMNAAANFAFANRQVISHGIVEVFLEVLQIGPADLGMAVVYDIAHNIAKRERHIVEGNPCELIVHRKGATRAFPKGHPDVPEPYRQVGQPVIIPGTMGTSSYVLVGTETAMAETWGSTCHGAGRVMSRHEALKRTSGDEVLRGLESKGIVVRCASLRGLAEEMPGAYKDVDEVVESVAGAGISRKVARMVPLFVMKG